VNPADQLLGNITRTFTTDEQWEMDFTDLTSKVHSTDLTVSRPTTKIEPDAYVTLEVYNVGSCAGYPVATTVFSQLALAEDHVPVSPAWVYATYSTACGAGMVINSPQQVTLTW